MVLRKLSQSFKISLALMLSVFSSGILQAAPAYAKPGDDVTADKQVYCNIEGNSGKWKAQLSNGNTEHEYPLTGVFVHDQNDVTSEMDAACAVQYGTVTTPEVAQEVVCGPDNDIYSVVDGDNYDVVDNGDGTFTLTADMGFVFSTSGTNTETLMAPEDMNTTCGTEDEVITTPEVAQEVVCGPDNDIYSVVDGDNYDVVDNGDGTFTLTADMGFVFSTSGTNTETLTVPADTNTTCPEEPVVCPANQEWFDKNDNQIVDEDECFKKVFVCKYVGTPGIDERLQTGGNPINVSVHAIPDPEEDGVHIGDMFADAHTHSIVIAFDEGQPEPDVSNCLSDIDFAVICVTTGVKVTLTNTGIIAGKATVNGTEYVVPANGSTDVSLGYDAATPFKTVVTVTINGVTSTQTVSCAPGQGGGQTLGDSTTKPQTLGTSTELPAALPATGGEANPMLILLASIMAYGVAYFLQGRRQLGQNRA